MNRRGAYVKKEQHILNVEARLEWLRAGLRAPEQLSGALTAALAYQRAFAALSVPGTSIRPLALNTLKTIANESLGSEAPEGKGFVYLESLRLKLKTLTAKRPLGRTVAARRHRRDQSVDEIVQALRASEQSNLLRSHAYVDLFSKVVVLLTTAALDDATRLRLHHLLQDHQDLYATLWTPTPPEKALRVIPGGKP